MTERLNRGQRKAQTREQLLDAATRVFAERGFEAASLDEVAAAAGYTKGAVYSNFASKTDLVIALIERKVAEQEAEHLQRFSGQDFASMTARLEEPETVPEEQQQWMVLAVEFWLYALRNERARDVMAKQYEQARSFVAGHLIGPAYASAGLEPPLAPRDLAIVIESLEIGLAFQAALDAEAVRPDLKADVLISLLGLSGEPGAAVAASPNGASTAKPKG
jgi:AcrR family transcriptional regulator